MWNKRKRLWYMLYFVVWFSWLWRWIGLTLQYELCSICGTRMCQYSLHSPILLTYQNIFVWCHCWLWSMMKYKWWGVALISAPFLFSELPGFYFDADRNRYFPLPSKCAKTESEKSFNGASSSTQVLTGTSIDHGSLMTLGRWVHQRCLCL